MLPYTIFVCLVAILAGVLNVHKHFAAPAAAPIVLNLFIISSLLITGWFFKVPAQQQVFYIACSVVVAGFAQIGLQFMVLRQKGVLIRPSWDIHSAAFKKVIFLMGPMILGLTVTQINTLADDLIALSFSNESGIPLDWSSVSYLYYAQRLYQFPLGVLGISLATAIFPVMSREAAKKDYDSLCKTIDHGFRATAFVAIPATAGMLLVARPLVSAIFEHGKFTAENTATTAWTLTFYSLGLFGFFAQQIATRAFYSMQDSKLPAITAVIAVVVNVSLNLILVWPMGTAGLALSTAICSYLQVVILVIALSKRLHHGVLKGLGKTLLKSGLSVAIMWFAGTNIQFLMANLPDNTIFNILRLVTVVTISGGIYIVCSILTRNEMLSLFTGKKRV